MGTSAEVYGSIFMLSNIGCDLLKYKKDLRIYSGAFCDFAKIESKMTHLN